jgi:hypothetical protein
VGRWLIDRSGGGVFGCEYSALEVHSWRDTDEAQ